MLVALYETDEGPHVVLTRRAGHLRTHRGEVSFPGGGREPGDESLWATACREAHEEVGLAADLPREIGELDRFLTVGSASLIHPFVAVLDAAPNLEADPAEVDAILLVPLAELLLDEVFHAESWSRSGKLRTLSFFDLFGDTVWGATAAILVQLLSVALGVEHSHNE